MDKIKKLYSIASGFFPEIALLLFFIFIHVGHLQADFWNDEIYSLTHFSFTPIENTLIDYHTTNNHIFYNLINNIYLKTIGVSSLYELMDAPYILRILPLIYGIITLIFTYLIVKRSFSRTLALITLILLITNIPYYNFATQLRGYGLSTMLLTITIYYVLVCIQSIKTKGLLILGSSVTLLNYTIPSNYYFTTSLFLCLFVYLLIQCRGSKHFVKDFISSPILKVLVSIVLGFIVSFVLYSLTKESVFSSQYVSNPDLSITSQVFFYAYYIIPSKSSFTWVIVFLGVLGVLYKLVKEKNLKPLVYLFGMFFFGPLLLIIFKGDEAPLRIFIPMFPFAMTILAIGIHFLFTAYFDKLFKKASSVIVFVFMLGVGVFVVENHQIEKQLLRDIESGGRSQNLYEQYYAAHYYPKIEMEKFSIIYRSNPLPVFVIGGEGITEYLNKYQINHSSLEYQNANVDSLLNDNPRIYIISNHPNKFQTKSFNTKRLNTSLNYHNILLLERK
ncbi:glycosyltransferase family 39 protein [Crocinitomicaceae bacterium]|nr:glycosyltransferase family 39 protein [Crocinitomicaceae bacterium]